MSVMRRSVTQASQVRKEFARFFEAGAVNCDSVDVSVKLWSDLIHGCGFQECVYRKLSADDASEKKHSCDELTRHWSRGPPGLRARYAEICPIIAITQPNNAVEMRIGWRK